jgi:alpha-L-fucosidase
MPDAAFSQRWFSRAKEVVDKYQPDLIWFDNKLFILDQQVLRDFLTHYYNRAADWGRDVVATYKHEDFHRGAGILDLERSRMAEGQDFPWLVDDSIDWGAWCDVQNPNYKSTNRLIDFLVDVVSKNGCVLLNVTPTAAGEIPQPVQERLLEMGRWLDLNGEAIYETRPWKIYGEGPMEIVEGHLSEHKNKDATHEEIRFTRKGDTLYATVLDWPRDRIVKIRALAKGSTLLGDIKQIELLGHNGRVTWARNNQELLVRLPSRRPCEHAFVLKIAAKGI